MEFLKHESIAKRILSMCRMKRPGAENGNVDFKVPESYCLKVINMALENAEKGKLPKKVNKIEDDYFWKYPDAILQSIPIEVIEEMNKEKYAGCRNALKCLARKSMPCAEINTLIAGELHRKLLARIAHEPDVTRRRHEKKNYVMKITAAGLAAADASDEAFEQIYASAPSNTDLIDYCVRIGLVPDLQSFSKLTDNGRFSVLVEAKQRLEGEVDQYINEINS